MSDPAIIAAPRTGRRVYLPSWPRRHPLAAALIALAVMLVIFDHLRGGARRGDDQARYHDRDFRVIRVVGVDTIEIDALDGSRAATRVRLIGVRAIDPGDDSKPDGIRKARQFVEKSLIGRTVNIVLPPGRTRDRDGRLLAYIYLDRDDELTFNARLISEGYARPEPETDHPLAGEFARLERRARAPGAAR
jgi:endonuclease YncB( thermonuclease family)